MATNDNSISKAQIAKIWATARDLGMDREMLYRLVPGGSISHLTRAEGSRLIEYLSALAGDTTLPHPHDAQHAPPEPPEGATPDQRQLIYSLFERIGWIENPHRAEGFLEKYAGVRTVEEITGRKRASAIIEALKSIDARQRRPLSPRRRAGKQDLLTLGNGSREQDA